MAEISRSALFGKLNTIAYRSVESATVFCKMRGNPYVELVHWIHQIFQMQNTDMHRICEHFQLDASRIATDLTAALDRLPRGATSISDFSPHLEMTTERAWVFASLMYGRHAVRTGDLMVALVETRELRNVLLSMSPQFAQIKGETLSDNFSSITAGSAEEQLGATDGFGETGGGAEPGEASGSMSPPQMGKQEALSKFTVDLTDRARKGEIDPIVGRDEEIRQIVDVLMRRRQNNPILTGEAGVGKTAVVEGFALRIASGDVPPPLKDVELRVLDVGMLQAGASMKGEFENRLKQLIEEVQQSTKPIILFIDEAHTLVGAGGASGTGDAANLLKPALARGTLRTIAATTWAEYKKHIEKDPALTRRFQVIHVGEPDDDKAVQMMRGIASSLEQHHRVLLLDEALEASVKLSRRYIPSRQLPDKSVSLLDTACARVAISQHAVPPRVDDCRRRIEALQTEQEIIGREEAVGVAVVNRKADVQEKLAAERSRLRELEQHWQREKALVDEILDLRARLRSTGSGEIEDASEQPEGVAEAGAEGPASSATSTASTTIDGKGNGESDSAESFTQVATEDDREAAETIDRPALLAELQQLQDELAQVQGEDPLILPSVDAQVVASVVGDWTGIPVGRMVKNEIDAVLRLADTLDQRVIGQRHGLDAIAKRIQTSRAGLENPSKPIGVFMLAGPSGVGKTETALALAEALYGDEDNVITINMSEFQEAHTVSTLKGAPPGYVGYGEGGILTEAVRRRPYSVVLLDEVEKAHPDVHEIFFQVFDKGWMEDGEGRYIDFHNTIILLTTNVGTELIANMCSDPELMPDPESVATALRDPLLKVFPPALLGRIVTIPYYPLSDDVLKQIIRLQLGRIVKRVSQNHQVPVSFDDAVIELIASRCTEVESGGRMIDAILTHSLLPTMSRELLTRMMEGRTLDRVQVTVRDEEFEYEFE